MAKCDYCGTTILFGGTKTATQRFCNATCAQRGQLLSIAAMFPPDVIDARTRDIHKGTCPRCQGAGPVDVQMSYRVWSALVMTSWQSRQLVACRSCGRRAALLDTLFCVVCGWWGLPWGLIMTPVQVTRNVVALSKGHLPQQPSAEPKRAVSLQLAAQAAARAKAEGRAG